MPNESSGIHEEPRAYQYAIESVENAAKTLLMLRDRTSIRAIDVSTELGVARSTAHRMVSTLAGVGLLRRNDGDRSFSAGYALVELGMAVIGAADLGSLILPVLSALAASTGETVQFLVRERDEVLFVHAAEGTYVIRSAPRIGTRLPAHVTSAGKCLLAVLSEEELFELYPSGYRWAGGTASAIRSRRQLLDELDRVAAQGWALNRSESEPGLLAVSRVVRDARGSAIGAVSVSGPAERLESRIAETVDELAHAIAGLEREIAGR